MAYFTLNFCYVYISCFCHVCAVSQSQLTDLKRFMLKILMKTWGHCDHKRFFSFLHKVFAVTFRAQRNTLEPRHDKTSSGVSDQARHKPACTATEASKSLEISAIESRYIILSKQRTTKALIRLRGCAG